MRVPDHAVFVVQIVFTTSSNTVGLRSILPAPTARMAFAAIAPIETFAPQWMQWAERLGLGERRLNVFGDGLRDALDPRAKVKIEH